MNRKMPRIPLEERIEREKLQEVDFLNVFYLFADDYFHALSEISQDDFYTRRYESTVRDVEGEKELPLVDLIYHAGDSLYEEEDPDWFGCCSSVGERSLNEAGNSLLYYILVEPFANILKFERS